VVCTYFILLGEVFVCSVLTLKADMSGEVHNKMCSRVLDYE